MAVYLMLTDSRAADVLPAIRTAGFDIKVESTSLDALRALEIAPLAVIVDCVTDPSASFVAMSDLRAARVGPIVAVVHEASLGTQPWHQVADELLASGASEEEIRVRFTMLQIRSGSSGEGSIRLGGLLIDADSYRASLRGRPLDLTYKEFELLKFLASRPGRVFTREDLLQQVWGYGFYGGTRTVDVHIRRLRAKLGVADEHLIETVRGVGYRAADLVL